MKYILIIALLCASFISFSQVDTRVIKNCGYTSEDRAMYGMLGSKQTDIRPDEHEVTNSTQIYYNSTSQSWCYKYTVYCTDPLNKEQKETEPVVQNIGCKNEPLLITSK